MEAHPYGVNGSVDEQAPGALEALHALQAAGVHPHAIPVVGDAFGAALQAATTPAEAAAVMAAAAGAAVSAGEDTPGGLHGLSSGGGGLGRSRLSSGTFKNRTGPSYCQVEGCGTALEGLKEYHQRYKVCEEHLKTPFIIKDGQQVRFCQQCGRFQPLEDFDDNKRSCRVRLQRHNARRRKRPRADGGVSGGGDLSEYGTSAAAAEMAKLAAQTYAAAAMGGAPQPLPSAKEIQDMHNALQFANTTLMHPTPLISGKAAGEEGGEEGTDAGAASATTPFVPAPEVMMLLLKGYAGMFHYVLDSASIRPLLPPSELPDQQAAAAGAGGLGLGGPGLDALQMQQLMQVQGVFGGAAGGLPMLLAGGEMAAAGMLAAAEGEGAQEAMEAAAAAAAAAAAGVGAEHEHEHVETAGEEQQGEQQQLQQQLQHEHEHGHGHPQQQHDEQQQQQHEEHGATATAALEQQQQQQAEAGHGGGGGSLTAEQVAAALIQPLTSDAQAAEGAMAAAAALAAAAGAHYFTTAPAQAAGVEAAEGRGGAGDGEEVMQQ